MYTIEIRKDGEIIQFWKTEELKIKDTTWETQVCIPRKAEPSEFEQAELKSNG